MSSTTAEKDRKQLLSNPKTVAVSQPPFQFSIALGEINLCSNPIADRGLPIQVCRGISAAVFRELYN